MCLSTVYTGEKKKKALAKLPKSGYYWKSVKSEGDGYQAIIVGVPFTRGWNVTRMMFHSWRYTIAYHLFRNKSDALSYASEHSEAAIRCKVEKKDIIAIGEQVSYLLPSAALCIVTTRFWCPKYKKQA